MDNTPGTNDWMFGLFGCFGDCSLCIITFCCPCYTIGKNAEFFGESCMSVACMYGNGCNLGPVLTWRLRQKLDIQGDMISDTLLGFCCSPCQILREARQIKLVRDSLENAPVVVDIDRK